MTAELLQPSVKKLDLNEKADKFEWAHYVAEFVSYKTFSEK